jgi:hypothetical protein
MIYLSVNSPNEVDYLMADFHTAFNNSNHKRILKSSGGLKTAEETPKG